MKMVKSAFLASAAGLVAMSGAQAADLPVKAKPVEYVKVCSLYGAGFYYIPGTDICMKIGGYVRYQINNNTSSITAGPFAGGSSVNNRLGPQGEIQQRVRAIATFDTRQQTAYGTLRTYLLMGFTQDSNANAGLVSGAGSNTPVYMTRAFIQIAGFTFGKATSFFDFISSAAVAYNAGYTYSPDTGDPGQLVGSYTAQFGNGLSATVGIEQSRRNNTINWNQTTPGATLFGALGGADNLSPAIAQASNMPDIVGNIRIDQAWGSAQISAAAHQVGAGYYGTAIGGGVGGTGLIESNGHPDDKWGWAVSGGLRLNAPMFGPGDYFQGAVVYSEGATRYASFTPTGGGALAYWSGASVGFGHSDDAYVAGNAPGTSVFGTGVNATTNNDIQLTTAWSVFASFEHFWTPALRTSLYGSYVDFSYNGVAKSQFCAFAAASAGALAGGAGCNPNWSAWNIGSRSQWNITKDLYVGVDVMYSKLNTATLGVNTLALGNGVVTGKGAGIYTISDQDVVSTTWRIHRDIVP